MLPLVDKPIIQYGVEEAVASGVDNIILVTGPGQERDRGSLRRLGRARDVPRSARQARPARRDPQDLRTDQLRLRAPGRAARPRACRARHARAGRARAVRRHPGRRCDRCDAAGAAADDRRLRARWTAPCSRSSGCPREQVSSYGVIAPTESLGGGVYRIRDLVEKPPAQEAPSDLAIIGRYILTPDIFEALARPRRIARARFSSPTGCDNCCASGPLYACVVDGVRHDTGNKLGFLKAVVYFALRRPDLAGPFREYLRSIGVEKASVK